MFYDKSKKSKYQKREGGHAALTLHQLGGIMDFNNYNFFSKHWTDLAKAYEPLVLARVIQEHKSLYFLDLGEKVIEGRVSGKMMHEALFSKDFPSVGDYVMVSLQNDFSIIHHILKRESVIERKEAGKSSDAQIIATNVDKVFICMSANENFNVRRLERYLAVSYQSGAIPIVVLTKVDLADDVSPYLRQVQQIAFGADIIMTSSHAEPYYDEVLAMIKPYETYVCIGSSGVGKSTLTNYLLEHKVLDVFETGKHDKGRHTTTYKALFRLKNHAFIIDTPGMREFALDDADLSESFKDIEDLSKSCKFRDCTHTKEPGCAVLNGIDKGLLSKDRLKSYHKLQKELIYQEKRRKLKLKAISRH